MIDDKKIEDAAKQHSEKSYISSYFQACYKDAFMDGVKWATNEFLKNGYLMIIQSLTDAILIAEMVTKTCQMQEQLILSS